MSTTTQRSRPSWYLPPVAESTLPLEPWRDPLTERLGASVRSGYTERFWLPVLGPTSTWLLRHLDTRFDDAPDGLLLDLNETARALGVAAGTGPKGPVLRALNRCVVFGLAQAVGHAVAVRRVVPPLPQKLVAQLPPALRTAHRRWISERDVAGRAG